jgi:hypothetical protein
MTPDDLNRIEKLAEASSKYDSWKKMVALYDALTPEVARELIRLARKGLTPSHLREMPHCASCSCGVAK